MQNLQESIEFLFNNILYPIFLPLGIFLAVIGVLLIILSFLNSGDAENRVKSGIFFVVGIALVLVKSFDIPGIITGFIQSLGN